MAIPWMRFRFLFELAAITSLFERSGQSTILSMSYSPFELSIKLSSGVQPEKSRRI